MKPLTMRISEADQHVGVYLYDPATPWSAACAEISRLPDHWWVCRVLVHQSLRRQGCGRRVLTTAIEKVFARAKVPIRVCPGGYNIPYRQQEKFYLACGFHRTKERGLLEIDLTTWTKNRA